MNTEINPGPLDEIQELIQREKERAEKSFESRRFDARLFERIGKAREPRPAVRLEFLRKPGPIGAVSALALAVAGLLLFRTFSPSPFSQAIRTMRAVLDRPGVSRGASGLDRTAQRIETPEYTELGWALKGVLYACEREALGDVSMTDAFSRVLQEGAARAASTRAGEKTAFPRPESFKVRTGEEFKIFFSGFLKKLEEV